MICARRVRRWMRRRVRRALLTLLLALVSISHARAGELSVGLGVATLPALSNGPLGGYGGLRERRADGLLDPPEARALVLTQDGKRVGIVTLDIVVIRPSLKHALDETIATLNLDPLILIATHTHSGPGGYVAGWLPERVTAGGFRPGLPEELISAARQALAGAVADLTPARSSSREVLLDLARNRRDERGPHETSLPVIRFDFAEPGRPIVLFAYGAHPTVLSPRSHVYSADYVGAARRALEAKGWRPIFLPGPLGDQEPRSRLGSLWPRSLALQRAQVEEIGGVLADAVQRGAIGLPQADFSAPPSSSFRLRTSVRRFDLPESRIRRFCPLWWVSPFVKGQVRRFLSRSTSITALRIGGAIIAALPAEPASALGDALRERLGGSGPVLAVAHANDWLGYAVDAERYRKGGYEACMSFFGPGLGALLIEQAELAARDLL